MLPVSSARVVVSTMFPSMLCGGGRNVLVLVLERQIDVDGGQDGKDIGLEERHEDFEQSKRNSRGKRDDAHALENCGRLEEEVLRGCEHQNQQQVARDHVGRESQPRSTS